MSIGIKVSGAWKDVAAVSVRVSGAWKTVSQAYVKVSGVWEELLNARGPASIIDRTTGTNIGDMTANGGLAAAFDGDTTQGGTTTANKTSVSSAGSAYVGKTTAAPTAVESVTVHGTDNQGYVASVNPSTTLTLFGKQGSAPANSGDGTSLGSTTFTDTANESTGRTINSSDTATYWDHVWVRLTHADGSARTVGIAELVITGWQ